MGVRERGFGSSAAHRPFCRPQRSSSRSARAFGVGSFSAQVEDAGRTGSSRCLSATLSCCDRRHRGHRERDASSAWLAGWLAGAAEAYTIRPGARWPDADKDAREKQTLRGGDAQYRMQVDQDGLWITMDRYY